jgi:hypothetical protein
VSYQSTLGIAPPCTKCMIAQTIQAASEYVVCVDEKTREFKVFCTSMGMPSCCKRLESEPKRLRVAAPALSSPVCRDLGALARWPLPSSNNGRVTHLNHCTSKIYRKQGHTASSSPEHRPVITSFPDCHAARHGPLRLAELDACHPTKRPPAELLESSQHLARAVRCRPVCCTR